MDSADALTDAAETPSRPRRWRGRLLGKYTLFLVSLVAFVLAVNGLVETWFMYRDTLARADRIQTAQAEAVARQVALFLSDTERQVSWATRASATGLDTRRADYTLLLRQVPAVADLAFVDGTGRELVRVGREGAPAADNMGPKPPPAADALKEGVWFGPAFFVGRDPYVLMALPHSGPNPGLTLARVSLRALPPLVGAVIPEFRHDTYLVDPAGRVLATAKGSASTVGDDLGRLPQVAALRQASRPPEITGEDLAGQKVLASGAPVEAMGWTVIVQRPVAQVLRPVFEFFERLAGLLVIGLGVAVVAGLVLARRMISPLQALHRGAEHFAAHRFDHRIVVRSGDELQELAGRLNRMADELSASYGRLEMKVEERTQDLNQSVRELRAVEEIGRAIASSLDLDAVLATVVQRAVALAGADAGALLAYDTEASSWRLAEAQGFPASPRLERGPLRPGAGAPDPAFGADGIVEVPDLARAEGFPLLAPTFEAGFRAARVVALKSPEERLGALVLYWRVPEAVPGLRTGVMQTLAHQAVLAMHNARLFREIDHKGRELEVAVAHRTQFFANMSHELRTPLNAVLGYSELLLDGLYGEMPERAVGVLERVQVNGKHLLGLINDVLDLTKMEAGALKLSLEAYSMADVVASVAAATESLAAAKGLALSVEAAPGLPLGVGDHRRLSQVLLNLVGNAIKFTDSGSVEIEARMVDTWFRVAVNDTGPGVSPEDRARIFEEFQQVEGSAGKAAGTGLGLAISRRLVSMHGGTIEVGPGPKGGSSFVMVVPVAAEPQDLAA